MTRARHKNDEDDCAIVGEMWSKRSKRAPQEDLKPERMLKLAITKHIDHKQEGDHKENAPRILKLAMTQHIDQKRLVVHKETASRILKHAMTQHIDHKQKNDRKKNSSTDCAIVGELWSKNSKHAHEEDLKRERILKLAMTQAADKGTMLPKSMLGNHSSSSSRFVLKEAPASSAAIANKYLASASRVQPTRKRREMGEEKSLYLASVSRVQPTPSRNIRSKRTTVALEKRRSVNSVRHINRVNDIVCAVKGVRQSTARLSSGPHKDHLKTKASSLRPSMVLLKEVISADDRRRKAAKAEAEAEAEEAAAVAAAIEEAERQRQGHKRATSAVVIHPRRRNVSSLAGSTNTQRMAGHVRNALFSAKSLSSAPSKRTKPSPSSYYSEYSDGEEDECLITNVAVSRKSRKAMDGQLDPNRIFQLAMAKRG